MPVSDLVRGILAKKISQAQDREAQDAWLDQWLRQRDLATDWDAIKWGFTPGLWMRQERDEMDMRSPVPQERMRIVSLVCCADKIDGCICETFQPCGGVHVFTAGCPAHGMVDGTRGEVQFTSTIHEVGERRTTTVNNGRRRSSDRSS